MSNKQGVLVWAYGASPKLYKPQASAKDQGSCTRAYNSTPLLPFIQRLGVLVNALVNTRMCRGLGKQANQSVG